MNLLPDNRLTHAVGRGIFFGILVAIVFTIVCAPALALPAPVPGGGPGHFDQGIPVYWPYHAILMSMGFILLVAGLIVARYHKTGNWYKSHVILQATGAACIIIGLFIGIYMVALSGFPHLRNIHEILGVTLGALVVITLLIGWSIRRVNTAKTGIRTGHRWLGKIVIGLMIINILLGLLFLSIILKR
ncbi:cytochrome b561 domain-containing protein [Methanoregula sp.]|uniref:cytochrome b561 domain-containing protein n=1 Tax=Methanoregula sp. TaxID=2052170 RepID=UPI003C756CD0